MQVHSNDLAELQRSERENGGYAAWSAARARGATKLGFIQWLQVRTQAFKSWYGDWQAGASGGASGLLLDADTGEPMLMHHGTEVLFDGFDDAHMGSQQGRGVRAHWFTSVADNAGFYGPIVRHAFVSLGRTLEVDGRDEHERAAPSRMARGAQGAGLDSLLLREVLDGSHVSDVCAVFSHRRAQLADCMIVDGVARPTMNTEGCEIHPSVNGIANFWRWFGDSAAVDHLGRPLVMYHATAADFSAFSKTGIRPNFTSPQKHLGYFFTDDPGYADRYTQRWDEFKDGANTMPVYLTMENPKREGIEKIEEIEDRLTQGAAKAYRVELQAQGYDGIVFEGSTPTGFVREYVAFQAGQIKSAIGNGGAYGPDNDGIAFSTSDETIEAIEVDGKFRPTQNGDGQPIHPTESGVRNFWRWFGDSASVDNQGRPLVFYHATGEDFSEFESKTRARVMYQDGRELKRADSWDLGEDASGAPEAFHYLALSDMESLTPQEALAHRQSELAGLKARNPGESFPDSERLVRDLQRLALGGAITKTLELRPSGVAPYFTPDRQYSFVRNAHQISNAVVMPVYLRMANPVRLDASAIESAGWRAQSYLDRGYDSAVFSGDASDLTQPDGMGNRAQAVVFDNKNIRSAMGNSGAFDGSVADIRFSDEVASEPRLSADLIDRVIEMHQHFPARPPGGMDQAQFRAFIDGRRQCLADLVQAITPHAEGMLLPVKAGTGYWGVSRETRTDGQPWRITRFDEHMQPLGHECHSSVQSAIESVLVWVDVQRLRGLAPTRHARDEGVTIKVDGVDRPRLNAAGQPIHPTEEGIVNFWKWFGDSRSVDDQGRPLVVYHGTNRDFTKFAKAGSKTKDPDSKSGFFFDSNPGVAENFAWEAGSPWGGNIKPVYLSITNPARAAFSLVGGKINLQRAADFIARAKADGHDGAVLKSKAGRHDGETYVAFSPKQIKSAIGNEGEFSRDSADIRFSDAHAHRVAMDGGMAQALCSLECLRSEAWQWAGRTADQTQADAAGDVEENLKGPERLNGLKVFHGSWEVNKPPVDVGLGVHVGTYEQALARLHALPQGRQPSIWEARLDVRSAVRLDDLGTWSLSNVLREVRRLGHINAIEADAIWDRWNQSDDRGWTALRQVLVDKGYGAIVYANEVEGPGDSYVVLNERCLSWHEADLPLTLCVDGKMRPTRNSDGKPIHALLEGVESFWRWFGDSPFVDEQGRPHVIYRGEGSGEERWTYAPGDTRFGGIFLTRDRATAQTYERQSRCAGAEPADPREFYVRASRVLDLTRDTKENRQFVAEWAKAFDSEGWLDRRSGEEIDPWDVVQAGDMHEYEGTMKPERWIDLVATALIDHEALIAFDMHAGQSVPVVVVRGESQIKSARVNAGSFDAGCNDIRFSVALDSDDSAPPVERARMVG